MKIATALITSTVSIGFLALTGPAFAGTVEGGEATDAAANDWTLDYTPVQNSGLILVADTPEVNKLSVDSVEDSPPLTAELDDVEYVKFNIRDFQYPVLGPVNLAVGRDYQELLNPHNAVHTRKVVYQSPDSGPYDIMPYQVSTAAKAQVKMNF